MKAAMKFVCLVLAFLVFGAVSVEAAEKSPMEVLARWAEDALAGYSAYDEFIADTSEAQVKIVFSVEGSVRDFKVLKIDFEDINESGKPMFSVVELHTLDRLTPERPLVLGMTFWGSIPHYGISYVDESGTTRNYAVHESGEDGSLLLVEFE